LAKKLSSLEAQELLSASKAQEFIGLREFLGVSKTDAILNEILASGRFSSPQL